MGIDDAGIAADQRGQRDRLGRGEGEVAAGTVMDFSVLAPAAELAVRPVGHLSLQNRLERIGIDRAFQAEFGRAPARPGTRLAVGGVVLRIVSILFVVAGALGRCSHRSDRGDHQIHRPYLRLRRSRSPGVGVPAFPSPLSAAVSGGVPAVLRALVSGAAFGVRA